MLGLIEGTAEALSYGLRAVSGFFSDRFKKRKILVLLGYGISSLAKPFFAVARAPLDVFMIRVSDRIGKAIRTAPRDALISESVSEKEQGVAFGIHRTLDQAGAIAGPIIASIILSLGLAVRDVFWLSIIPGGMALLLIVLFVREQVSKSMDSFHFLLDIKQILQGDFSVLLFIVGIFSLGAYNFSFVLLHAQEAGVGDAFLPLIYAAINITHTAIAIPAGILSDRIGKETVLIFGYGVFLSTSLWMILFPATSFMAFVVAALFGAYVGITHTIQRALIPGYVERNLRATAYGLYYLVVGSAFFISNTLIGTLWESFGSSIAATYSSMLSMLAISGMLFFVLRNSRYHS
jgi:MFS family permease